MSGCATSSSSSGDDEDEGRGRSKRARHDDAEGGPHAGRSPTRIKHEKKKKKDHKKKEYKHDKKAERKAAKDGEKLLRESSDGLMLKVDKRLSKRPELIGTKDGAGKGLLHLACAGGDFSTCLLLVRRRADVHAVDGRGDTPLHAATRAKHWDVADMLVEKGAHGNVKNEEGVTAGDMGLDRARQEREKDEAKRLEEHRRMSEKRKALEAEAEERMARQREEMEWKEKIMDQESFEHLEGGWGQKGAGMIATSHRDGQGCFWESWEEAPDELNDEDWWAEMARRMHERQRSYHAGGGGSAKIHSHRPPEAEPRVQPLGTRFHAEGEAPRLQTAPASTQARDTLEAFMERAAEHASSWERFLCSKQDSISYSDVPWPYVPPGGDLASEAMMVPHPSLGPAGDSVRKRACREALRRWHPDKFGQKFASRIAGDADKVMERVKFISQALTSLV